MKKYYSNLKIRTKILLGFFMVSVIMLLMVAYTLIGLRGIIGSYENLTEGHFPRRDTRFEYRHAFESMQRHTNAMLMYAGIGDTANIELSYSRAYKALQDAFASIDDYLQLVANDDFIPPENKELRRATSEQVKDILRNYHRSIVYSVFHYALEGDVAAGIQTLQDGQRIYDHLAEVNAFLNNISDVWIAGIEEDMNRTEALTYRIIIIALILIALGSVCISILTANSISKPVLLVTNTLKDIVQGEGDLTAVIQTNSGDEIGRMAHYFNQTLEKIKNLVINIKAESATLSNIGNDLAANMNETAAAVNKIALNVQNINGRVANQSASVSQAHATMDHLVTNIDKLDGHVEKMSGNVSSASSAIEEMAANIRSVTDTLNKNSANVKALMEASEVGRTGLGEVAEDIKVIAQESEGILEINAVMENIASQTNLLSMNAAIEAAHAGDAGKGFAVVAGEIRKLAENSSAQSKTISSVLKKMKSSIDKITCSTKNMLDKFETIDNGVKVVAQQEDNILHSMKEQEAGSRQIVEGVLEITEITRQVKAGSKEMLEGAKKVIKESEALETTTRQINSSMTAMAGETDQINKAVSHVNDISNKNRHAIDELIKGVSRFKVG